MRIEIKQKELKDNKLELSRIQLYYLVAIKHCHPKIWGDLKDIIYTVEEKDKEIHKEV